MPLVLTLHQGDAQASFVEHPTEVARKALIAAAEVEGGVWPSLLLRAAASLPERAPLLAESDSLTPFEAWERHQAAIDAAPSRI